MRRGAGRAAWGGGAAQGILGPGIGGIQMVGSGKAGPVPSDGLGQDGSGREAGVTPWERGILSGLSFDGSADTDEIMERVSGILWEYFRFDCRSEQKRKENRKRIKSMIRPFRFVRPAHGVIVREYTE